MNFLNSGNDATMEPKTIKRRVKSKGVCNIKSNHN